MMWITLADNRQAPIGPIPSDSEMIGLFKTMVAYAGTFTVEGDEVTHNVDASWNQAWTGTQQTRFYKLDGSILTLTSPPMRSPLGAPIGIFTLLLERIE